MQGDSLGSFIGLTFIFAMVIGLFLIAYEDGIPFSLFKKLRCKLGLHKIRNKIGQLKINVYYCRFCKKPRKHPELKVLDGGKKVFDTKFRF